MRVEDFYTLNSCEKFYKFQKAQERKENSREKVLLNVIKELCKLLQNQQSLSALRQMLIQRISSYDITDFAYDWQASEKRNNDYCVFMRFLNWFISQEFQVVDTNVTCEKKIKETIFTSEVDMIAVGADKLYSAFFITFEEPTRSDIGKSCSTKTAYDLKMLIAKSVLEQTYPGIKVYDLHIMAGADRMGLRKTFQLLETKEGNGQLIVYEKLLKGGEKLEEMLSSMMELVLQTPLKEKCFDCKFKESCRNPIVKLENVKNYEVKDKRIYQIPTFTKRQEQVIQHQNGPLLVCAGPGSGKTAVLIGRIKRLIEEGVDPSFLLAITFTTKAAEELRERCLTFLDEYDLPNIETFNSLGYEILRKNKNLLNEKIDLLDEVKKLQLLENLTSATEKLQGFAYGLTREENYAPHGFLKTLSRRVNEYTGLKSNSDLMDYFYKNHPELNRMQFDQFMMLYQKAVKSQGFITHDEQVSLAVKLLKEHPNILAKYQNVFKYIMVDEFQDVNKDQVELVYLLGAHGNVIPVGDDDQSIYAFRGGSSKYMKEFQQKFKCDAIILNENFRSKKSIVEGAVELIASEEGRYQKDLCAAREEDDEPILLVKNGTDSLTKIIERCIADGYKYSDIAILNQKNEPLEKLRPVLLGSGIPAQLGKNRLINDGLFRLIYLLLINAGESMIEKISEEEWIIPLYEKAKQYTLTCKSAEEFVTAISYIFKVENTVSSATILALITEKKICSMEALKETFENMIHCQSEERIEYGRKDEVILMTVHDAKGKEFPVVIIEDGDAYENASKEDKNLLYVAMTRAKDQLYIQTERDYLQLASAEKEEI